MVPRISERQQAAPTSGAIDKRQNQRARPACATPPRTTRRNAGHDARPGHAQPTTGMATSNNHTRTMSEHHEAGRTTRRGTSNRTNAQDQRGWSGINAITRTTRATPHPHQSHRGDALAPCPAWFPLTRTRQRSRGTGKRQHPLARDRVLDRPSVPGEEYAPRPRCPPANPRVASDPARTDARGAPPRSLVDEPCMRSMSGHARAWRGNHRPLLVGNALTMIA
ncbi:hypothetical protein G1C97_0522 [Bifidobacterium sp. DSM 109959]|uniref:Uncharacterized protein n=1 Tax=Bifidobacterium olomucense TaxID=2675324 RepID=A0A7Y0EWX6_9BIFI|nr:hypothetical protein [Bifidobacterium sp. DSM 109959]